MPSIGSSTSRVGDGLGSRSVDILLGSIAGGTLRDAMDRPLLVVETLSGPYGPYHVATSAQGVVAAEWLTSVDDFGERVGRRRQAEVVPRRRPPAEPSGRPTARRRATRRRSASSRASRPTVARSGRPGRSTRLGPAGPARGPPARLRRDRELRRHRAAGRCAARGPRRRRRDGPQPGDAHRPVPPGHRRRRDAWAATAATGRSSASTPRAQARAAPARGRHGRGALSLDSAHRSFERATRSSGIDEHRGVGAGAAGGHMTAATAPTPGTVDVRGLPSARLLAPVARPADLDGRLVADRPRGRDLRLRQDPVGPRWSGSRSSSRPSRASSSACSRACTSTATTASGS